jgi:hypothetical protein
VFSPSTAYFRQALLMMRPKKRLAKLMAENFAIAVREDGAKN